jgi:hypothetical protein
VLQHAHVLGGRRESHLQGRGELAEVPLSPRKLPDDRPPGGVGQRVKHEVQPKIASTTTPKLQRAPGVGWHVGPTVHEALSCREGPSCSWRLE